MVRRRGTSGDGDFVKAQAAAWLARLQRTERSPATDAGLHDWLAESEEHRRAFEHAVELWELVRGTAAMDVEAAYSTRARSGRSVRALAVFASFFALAFALFLLIGQSPRSHDLETQVGQRLASVLDDRSRVMLNTDSRLEILFTAKERRIRLSSGEVLFEVAKGDPRPFIVISGNEQIRAIGTKFVVRREPQRTAVTLLEGRVQVTRRNEDKARAARSSPVVALQPGERLTVGGESAPVLDRPALTTVTAWQRAEVVLENTPLTLAAYEFNRYSSSRTIVVDPALAHLRISGVFGTHDISEFAQTVAVVHGVRLHSNETNLILLPPA